MGIFFVYLHVLNYLDNIKGNFLYFITSHYSLVFKNLQMLVVIIKNNYNFFLQQILLSYRRKAKKLPLVFRVLPLININFYAYLKANKLDLFAIQNKAQRLEYLKESISFLKVISPFYQRNSAFNYI
ncbi:MAG: hypothetical protein RCG15_06625 [Candidatus Rickettsia vulgarisii]